MDDYAGRVLADRYRLPLPPSDEFELVETRAFDAYSGQEVLLRQIPLPEVVEAEVVGEGGLGEGASGAGEEAGPGGRTAGPRGGRTTQGAGDPAVRRALDAANAAAQVPDHPRLDQVFHVFAEAGSLWIVSELIPARPLAALLAERTLTPHRAAEVAADVLTALRALHAHGWTHRNITARTVLVCDDGRAVLTGLAAGAAEEALCGYDPVPPESLRGGGPGLRPAVPAGSVEGPAGPGRPVGPPSGGRAAIATARAADGGSGQRPPAPARNGSLQAPAGPAYRDQGAAGGFLSQAAAHAAAQGPPHGSPQGGVPEPDPRAVRAGAIAAYRAGTQAAARANADTNAPDDSSGGSAAWGGGSAASGAAPTGPAPNSAAWSADALVKTGSQSALRRPGGPAGEGAAPHAASDAGVAEGSAGEAAGVGSAGSAGFPVTSGAGEAAVPGGNGRAQTDSTEPWGHNGNGRQGRGPQTALGAERARQARMVVVGPVTERWAPEQAGPVHENWRLAPPVGPAADLWALGALLFRAVQGHAPYPEETAAELVQLVCAEPPAYAEECGALRPVVESLMRKDPAERPDFEELRGWLRSLIRSAPEPELGSRTVTVPSIGPGAPSDPSRLPIKRRRGELVRRRRSGASAAVPHGRHKKAHKAPHRTVTKQPAPPPRSQQLRMEHPE
ncbi:protein kinase, partial [Streptomyces sp. NPDC057654]|uniref:protein kinase n=1 Tax=Streptomyces sp. NPDC057654 TaxID=3346196 RepID=UPI003688D4ED